MEQEVKKVSLIAVTAKGYTKEEALRNAGIALDVKYDATLAWKKDGKPEGNDLNTFAHEYIYDKVKGATGVGFVIKVEAGQPDNRERPYKVTNSVTKGTTKYKMVYEGLVNYTKTEAGTIVFTKVGKTEAVEAAKEYVKQHRTAVKIRKARVVSNGNDLATTVEYAPSLGTTLGTYTFFGYEA